MPLIDGKFEPLELPEKHARVLLTPGYKYRVLHGGRYGSKDWSSAQVIIERAVREPIRVVCTREIQKSIRDSIHQLLTDTIDRLGYSEYFDVGETKIEGVNGSKFLFTGLRDLNSKSIKSLERVNVAIVGEAEDLTKKSCDRFWPTIFRQPGAELWIIYNDQFTSDFIHQLCVANKPDGMIEERVSYLDLPDEWVDKSFREEAERVKIENEDYYNYLFLGIPRKGGRFFPEFGEHLIGFPRDIPPHECKLYGSLDYGDGQGEGAGATSYGHWHIDSNGKPIRMFTYYMKGQTASVYAREIVAMIKAFTYTGGLMPKQVFADPSMFIKTRRLDGNYDKSIADIFIEAGLPLVKANNDRVGGWRTVREFCTLDDEGKQKFEYWDGFNDEFESEMEGLKHKELPNGTISDDCEKVHDHSCDDCRYFLIEAMGIKSRLLKKKKRISVDDAVRRFEFNQTRRGK